MAQDTYAWTCPCGRLCGKRHAHCPDCMTHWSAGTPHSNTPKSPRSYAQQESWEWPQDRGRSSKKQNRQNPQTRSASQRKGKGKGHHGDATTPSPFQQTTMTPWPAQETPFAFPAPPSQSALPASSTTSSSPMDMELLSAIRKLYPDISQAPEDLQAAVEKVEKASTKMFGKDLHKASTAVDKAAKELRNLREAKMGHRGKWLQHLRDAAVSWEAQLKQYTDQQSNYSGLIKKAKLELETARKTLSILNKKAADAHGGELPETEAVAEPEELAKDQEARELEQQVQAVLQSCAKSVNKDEIMEVSEEDEEEPKNKRPRSLDPFGGPGRGGGLS